jgi:dephospho-CoA kinase
MIKVGISGNRYSGKSTICKMFKQISIPVFDADTVLKFILGHEITIVNEIRKNVGTQIFKSPEFKNLSEINPRLIKNKDTFDKIINCAEYELMQAYEKFNSKNSNSIYTIFHSSILFERSWNEKMNYNINVFCPKITRMERCKEVTKTLTNPNGMKISDISFLLRNEIDDIDKNKMCNFVIHNYEAGDPLTQVNDIDQRIIDRYIKSEQTKESIVLKHY